MKTFYKVTKQFTSGILEGMVVTEVTSIQFEIGKEYSSCTNKTKYIVTSCEEL